MSAAFVPGRIRRRDCEEGAGSGGFVAGMAGELGGSCTSGKGGGDGRRGDVAGECGGAATAAIVDIYPRLSGCKRSVFLKRRLM